jgi:DNA repair protein RadC
MLRFGPTPLTDSELLAILIGAGTKARDALELARDLLERSGGVHGLSGLSQTELGAVLGLGPAGAARIRAALELGRRHLEGPPHRRRMLKQPGDAVGWSPPRAWET